MMVPMQVGSELQGTPVMLTESFSVGQVVNVFIVLGCVTWMLIAKMDQMKKTVSLLIVPFVGYIKRL
jgi:hypothetical protein